MIRPAWLTRPLALALAALACGVLFAVTPPQFDRTRITWQPQNASDSGTLRLTRGSPERFTATTTCDRARSVDEGSALLLAGSMSITRQADVVTFTSTSASPSVSVDLPASGECRIESVYDSETSLISLSNGSESDTATSDPPTVTTLITVGDPSAVERVEIVTKVGAVSPSLLRALLGAGSLLLAGAAMWSTRRARPEHQRRYRLRNLIQGFRPVDGAVAATLVPLAIIMPSYVDDGWVYSRVSVLHDRRWFGAQYSMGDAWLPQGLPHETAYALVTESGGQFAHIRILVAVSLTLGWVILRRGVLAPTVGEKAAAWPPVAATFVLFGGAWLMTLRAEPVVVFFGILTLVAWQRMGESPAPKPLFWGLIGAGFALTAHQTGWVALGPAVMMIAWGTCAMRNKRVSGPEIATAVLAATAVVCVATFVAVDVATTLEGARAFTADTAYTVGPLNELARYRSLLFDGASLRIFSMLVVAAVLVMASRLGDWADPRQTRLFTVSILWMGGLCLTSSKFMWHLGVYAVPAVLLMSLLAPRSQVTTRGRAGVWLLAPVLVMMSWLTAASPGKFGDFDLQSLAWVDLYAALTTNFAQKWWLAALAASGALAWLVCPRIPRVGNALLCLCLTWPLILASSWLLGDAHEPGPSAVGENYRQLRGEDSCGPLPDDGVIVGADALAVADSQPQTSPIKRQVEGSRGELARGGFPRQQGMTTGPFDDDVEVWGSWTQDPGDESADAHTGRLDSPVYLIDDVRELAIWSAAGSVDSISAALLFRADDGRAIGTIPVALSASAAWRLQVITVPEGASTVTARIDDNNGGFGGWAALTTPAQAQHQDAADVLKVESAYVSPFIALQFSCAQLPDMTSGVWGQVNYLYRNDFFFETGHLTDLTATQTLCFAQDDCLVRLDYSMAAVKVERLSG